MRSTEQLLQGGQLHKLAGEDGPAGKVKRILVVDDSVTVREVEARILRNAGYHVEMAVDGVDGWNMLKSGEFDLVVTDLDMPRMTGIEFTRLIRAEEALKNIPIVVVSYKDRSSDREAAIESGANCYVSKSSFQDQGLVMAVQKLMGAT